MASSVRASRIPDRLARARGLAAGEEDREAAGSSASRGRVRDQRASRAVRESHRARSRWPGSRRASGRRHKRHAPRATVHRARHGHRRGRTPRWDLGVRARGGVERAPRRWRPPPASRTGRRPGLVMSQRRRAHARHVRIHDGEHRARGDGGIHAEPRRAGLHAGFRRERWGQVTIAPRPRERLSVSARSVRAGAPSDLGARIAVVWALPRTVAR